MCALIKGGIKLESIQWHRNSFVLLWAGVGSKLMARIWNQCWSYYYYRCFPLSYIRFDNYNGSFNKWQPLFVNSALRTKQDYLLSKKKGKACTASHLVYINMLGQEKNNLFLVTFFFKLGWSPRIFSLSDIFSWYSWYFGAFLVICQKANKNVDIHGV